MKINSIKKIKDENKHLLGKQIEIEGWIRYKRVSKNIIFLDIFDGSDLEGIQAIIRKNDSEKLAKNLGKDLYILFLDAALYVPIIISGVLKLNEKNGKEELIINEVIEFNKPLLNNTIGKKEHGLEFLRENAHLRAKTKLFQSIYKIRSTAYYNINNFFEKEQFINVTTPIVTTNDAEGAGETFNLTLNNNKKFWNNSSGSLTVSGQLHAESFAQAFKNVYTFGPTFRAENSNTKRHAAEFWMLEPEMAFYNYHQAMDNAEKLVKYIIEKVLEQCPDELKFLQEFNKNNLTTDLKKFKSGKYKRITFDEALDILNSNNEALDILNSNKKQNDNSTEISITDKKDLTTEDESYLAGEYFKAPVFVYDYLKVIKPFYMYRNSDQRTVRGFDLLVPKVGELIGGSQREEDYEKILANLQEKEIAAKTLEWYLELRKFGYAKSSGYGVGFDRLIMFLTGMDNIRDVAPFPRNPGNLIY